MQPTPTVRYAECLVHARWGPDAFLSQKPVPFMVDKKLAHYEIVELLGKGGMGEVYRARDSKLERDVALKILPNELASDPERAARFQREARALASLQHPNVASIYGFEEVDGVRFLVMELVEGSDLAQRLRQGAIPPDEALDIARQIAAGLEAAHETGLVHRDLKPANIMLTPSGEVKILDFGLARAWFGDANDERDIAHSPTITAAMTQAGTILGTAAYMSPEQARGKNVDRRADIWAFGVILWEMLTGKQLFEGETVSDTLAAVLRAEPTWESLPTESAPVLCHLIERSLQRDPKRRLRDIGEARILLEGGEVGSSILGLSALGTPADTATATKKGWPLPALGVIALVCLVLGSVLGWKVLAKPAGPQLLHLMIPPPEDSEFNLDDNAPGPARLSPDGTMVTFTAIDDKGVTALYLRYLDQPEAAQLSGTETAAYPFWSADNRYIGFFSMKEGKLRKIAVRGGPPVTLCPASNGKGGSWNKDGVILFAPSHDAVIHRVSDTGGDPIAITKFQGTEDSHRHPRFLPDGKHFLYLARQPNVGGMYSIYLASLDSTETPRVITKSEAQPEYSKGSLLTVREGVLLATPFKLSDEKLTEGGTPLVDNVYVYSSGAAVGNYSASTTGMLLYQTGSAVATRFLQSTDLSTNSTSVLGESGQVYFPRISPDGKLAVVEIKSGDDESSDLWLVDLQSGLRTRFTFAKGNESFPTWTPDGKYIIYGASHDSTFQIVKQPLEGTGSATVLVESKTAPPPLLGKPRWEFASL